MPHRKTPRPRMNNPNTTDPMIATAFAAAIELAANQALRYDPGTRVRLQKLAGTVLKLDCKAPSLTLFFSVQTSPEEQNHKSNTELSVAAHSEANADTVVQGSLISLLGVLLSSSQGTAHSLADSGVTIIGKTSLLSEYQAIIQQLDIDWEEPLNEVLGVVPGHQVAELLRQGTRWTKARNNHLYAYFGDYLKEELRATPSAYELERFNETVDQLKSDADRLEARLEAFLNRQK